MPYFRLKHGSHVVGSGADAKYFNAMDPRANTVESDENLAEQDPARWEEVDALPPQRKKASLPPPPPPATDQDRFEASLLRSMSGPELESEEKRLERQLESIRTRRATAQKAEQFQPQEPPQGDETQPKPPAVAGGDDGLEDKTIPELRQIAADDEVDLRGVTKKEEIVAKIRQARG